ncbi:glycosyltransferase [Halorubrum ezzemoulense]|nr:glycosyltransferase [Halorubrum ezzemoulense]MDB9281712.1 glycosyltransferase [Halorubrum ezzemoulense]MDB9285205.1 glycosyltransferase [Halorubrum ezzemoulense]
MNDIAVEVDQKVIIQVGESSIKPTNAEWFEFCSPEEHSSYISDADLVVSHAGTGTILKAIQVESKIVLFPRLSEKNEARNNHQVEQSRTWNDLLDLPVAFDKDDLRSFVMNPSDLPDTSRGNSNKIVEEMQKQLESIL